MSVPAGPDLFKKPIVFFDGYCGLCNRFVDFALKRDKKRALLFASLQGQTAQRVLDRECIERSDSVVLFENGKCLVRSVAILRTLSLIGGIYKGAVIFRIVPRPIRDFIYDWIARHRYKWFGRREQCRVPTPEDRDRLLD